MEAGSQTNPKAASIGNPIQSGLLKWVRLKQLQSEVVVPVARRALNQN